MAVFYGLVAFFIFLLLRALLVRPAVISPSAPFETDTGYMAPEYMARFAPKWGDEVIRLLASRVVEIRVGNIRGSGFIVDTQHILTAWHVVHDHGPVSSLRFAGPAQGLGKVRARSFKGSDGFDMAVITLTEPLEGDFPPVPVAKASRQPIEVFGVSLVQRDWMRNHVEPTHDAAKAEFGSSDSHWVPGDSGSVLLTAKGEMAAVVSQAVTRRLPPHISQRHGNLGPSILAIQKCLQGCWTPGEVVTKTAVSA
jgi:hypothetical protein